MMIALYCLHILNRVDYYNWTPDSYCALIQGFRIRFEKPFFIVIRWSFSEGGPRWWNGKHNRLRIWELGVRIPHEALCVHGDPPAGEQIQVSAQNMSQWWNGKHGSFKRASSMKVRVLPGTQLCDIDCFPCPDAKAVVYFDVKFCPQLCKLSQCAFSSIKLTPAASKTFADLPWW